MSYTPPLAQRVRPQHLDEIIGNAHATQSGSILRSIVDDAEPLSVGILLYGPSGSGKTSIAHAIACMTDREFISLSATTTGTKKLKDIIYTDYDTPPIVFVDEVHYFNKTQQDILLPAIEDGTITFIGATTHNPSFSLATALTSRCVLIALEQLSAYDVATAIDRAIAHPEGFNSTITIDTEAKDILAHKSGGDVRVALTHLEAASKLMRARHDDTITADDVTATTNSMATRYDADGDNHYDIISAFIKSMRDSDTNGTVYWLARLIDSGEDPRFIARRLMIHASEDVGLTQSDVLVTCVAAAEATERIGLPEARIILSHAALAIATAPKSNAAYKAIADGLNAVRAQPSLDVPNHLKDAHYKGARALGHGEGYVYPHDLPGHVPDTTPHNLPAELKLDAPLYTPTKNGAEADIAYRQSIINQHQRKH